MGRAYCKEKQTNELTEWINASRGKEGIKASKQQRKEGKGDKISKLSHPQTASEKALN